MLSVRITPRIADVKRQSSQAGGADFIHRKDHRMLDIGKAPVRRSLGEWPGDESLSGEHYTSADIFDVDIEALVKSQWLLVDHASRIPNRGDFFLFEIGKESIIIVRQGPEDIGAFYNVCRHRGSRVCVKPEGNARVLTCPYHAWSYGLDGSLRGAPMMPSSFDKALYGLKPVHADVFEGLIFVNFAKDEPPDFERHVAPFRALICPSALSRTKIAVRKSYPTAANWKLVVENFFECYHCGPAHPTYCAVHDRLKLRAQFVGMDKTRLSAEHPEIEAYEQVRAAWQKQAAGMGHPVGGFADDPNSESLQQGSRSPIGNNHLTETKRGMPAAPLLGAYLQYDGGRTGALFNSVSSTFVSNDFGVLIRITPRSAQMTDVEAMWLVREDALVGDDYDPEEIAHVWDVTLNEDKTIVENNQLGVNSSVYEPGPHSFLEGRVSDFIEWYLRNIRGLNPA